MKTVWIIIGVVALAIVVIVGSSKFTTKYRTENPNSVKTEEIVKVNDDVERADEMNPDFAQNKVHLLNKKQGFQETEGEKFAKVLDTCIQKRDFGNAYLSLDDQINVTKNLDSLSGKIKKYSQDKKHKENAAILKVGESSGKDGKEDFFPSGTTDVLEFGANEKAISFIYVHPGQYYEVRPTTNCRVTFNKIEIHANETTKFMVNEPGFINVTGEGKKGKAFITVI